MPSRFVLVLVCGFAATHSQSVWADQVVLRNGDRLTGAILKSDSKELTLKSEFAGTVTIQWDAVESISAPEPLTVTLKDGGTIVGPVTTSGQQLSVATQNAGTVVTTKDAVQTIRNKEEQAAYERELERFRNPGLLDLCGGYVDTGLALARGNSHTTTFTMGANATRATTRDKINFYFTSLYSSQRAAGVSGATANARRGGVRYDLNISKNVFGFGFTDLESDQFQALDLRWVAGGGLGYHVYKKEKSFLDIFGGGASNKEFFTNNIHRSSGEVLLGNELLYQLSGSTTLQQRFVAYPNASEPGAYRLNFDGSAITRLRKWLSWQLTLSDRYLSNPVFGHRKNDVILTTGLRMAIAR